MRVLFVRPQPSPITIGLQHLMIVEPLELEILATLIKDKHIVQITDLILDEKDFDFHLKAFDPDVLCLTGYITHIPVIIDCCKKAKDYNHKIITVVGGVHVEKYPEDIDDQSINYRVVRNATRVFPALIDFIATGSSFPQGALRFGELLNEDQLPDYDFFYPIADRSLTKKYRGKYFYVFHDKVALVKTSFGCPYKCKFCFCRKITGDKYYARPVEDVIDELEQIDEKEIYIVDDDFLVSVSRTEKFIKNLRERGIRKNYLVYGRADFIAQNPMLIKQFKEVGLRTVIVGLESFEDNELESYNKQTNSSTNRRAMDILNWYKVDCYAAVIIPPSWDHQDFRRAGDVMLELGIRFVNLQPLTPLKGTGIEVEEHQLAISRKEFEKWDLAHVSINPEKMSLQEFYNNIHDLYIRIIFYPKNLIRLLKYPILMQLKMAKGMNRVKQQYKLKIMESTQNA